MRRDVFINLIPREARAEVFLEVCPPPHSKFLLPATSIVGPDDVPVVFQRLRAGGGEELPYVDELRSVH
jgi:hypothetical protein